MSLVDVAIAAIIVISALISLLRGFVREVLSLIAWVVAFAAVYKFSLPTAELLTDLIDNAVLRNVAGVLLVLFGTLIVVGLINMLIASLIDKAGLSGTDRTLGMIFGLARGVAIVLVFVLLGGLTPAPAEPWWRESQLLLPFESMSLTIIDWLPPDYAQHFSY
ncbi:MAG: CvpA family protein [Pseudomonadota bacterium]